MPEHLWHDTGNSKVEIVSLIPHGKAKQWYTHAVESMNGDWDELKDKFHLAFFPMSYIDFLPREILNFEQHKESIGAAWARLVFTRRHIVATLLFGY